ncbi:hypothetical protein [Paludisphaera mucosa]|uniref:Uncharacterized protein n=1 Tax=Paludisphaera mucosa TaxID=3030827 RepID=A0ABT6FI19_9BACT|nr:hypothetical protein [Paludisphaera mucosa]MDG3007222.1 hypothetical protein [Paludisphaera mucosa]
MRLQRQAFEVFADYHQFYLWDRGMTQEAPEEYTDEDVRRRIKTGPHVVVIQPERDMTVAVEVEIHDAEPACDLDAWDHVAEASLHLRTGRLQVHECTGGPVAEFAIEPGWYRVRSHHGGFDTIEEAGTDGDDHYLAVLWPAPADDVRILKQWDPGSPS